MVNPCYKPCARGDEWVCVGELYLHRKVPTLVRRICRAVDNDSNAITIFMFANNIRALKQCNITFYATPSHLFLITVHILSTFEATIGAEGGEEAEAER